MHIFSRAALLLLAGAAPTHAQSLACSGAAPAWVVARTDDAARFTFEGATTEMAVKLETNAEGRDLPRALTLIGDRDTAIVLIDQTACGPLDNRLPLTAYVMTQRGQTPILLSGCCQGLE